MNVFLLILVALCFMCLYRIHAGPSAPDRVVAVDIMGNIIIGILALLVVIPNGRGFFIDIALSFALLAFIGTIVLAKYLEGRPLDE